MIRAAEAAEAPALIAALADREAGAMFLLAALHAGRLQAPGATAADRHALHAWVAADGIIGLSGGGHLIAHWPAADGAALRLPLAGRGVATVLAPDGQAPRLLAGLIPGAPPPRHAAEEPGFSLELDALRLPAAPGAVLDPLSPADRDLARAWRVDYLGALFAVPKAEAAPRADRDVARWLAEGTHAILRQDGRPVALAGINARTPDAVQVGAVWVPPALRGQGHARRAVGLMLAAERARGVRRAHLFAAGPAAVAVYRALGFRARGTMGVIELPVPVQVPP